IGISPIDRSSLILGTLSGVFASRRNRLVNNLYPRPYFLLAGGITGFRKAICYVNKSPSLKY
ncbi:MAG: hypothetical protein MHMPM18_004429, partial [Marteilia pararefringens]